MLYGIDVASWQPTVRWITFILTVAAMVWSVRGTWQGVKGDLSAEAGYNISWLAIMLGIAGFQSGYLFEGVPEVIHWRNVVNSMLINVGLIVFLIVSWVRQYEKYDLFGHKGWLIRLIQRLRK